MTAGFAQSGPERFREVVAGRFGLRFEDAKLGFLGDVLIRRAEALGAPVEAYMNDIAASGNGPEAGLLADELTVGETYFFRNGDQFRAFSGAVVPDRMAARAPAQSLSILSAGCSSGEEPFTIAMLMHDAAPGWQVSIRAVDLNPAALRKATNGRFSNWALRDTPPGMRRRWFKPHGRDLALDPQILAAVHFDQRNLADPDSDVWQPEAYDAVFCRNVIMYFTPEVQQAVIDRIARSIAPGGYLFLGHAETLRGLSQDFHLVHTHDTFYYQRRQSGERRAQGSVDLDTFAPRAGAIPADPDWFAAIGKSSRRIEVLAKPAPAATPPPRPRWSLGLALALLQLERFAEALALIRDMPAEARDDPDVLLLKALLLVQAGQLAAAGDVCRTLLAQDELSAGSHYVLALCREAGGDIDGAVHDYNLASHLDPLFAMPLLRRGLLARRSGQTAEAAAALSRALDLLRREDTARLLLFGGGFTRGALTRLCESELRACEASP